MGNRFPNGFDVERKKADKASDRALYKYLRVHILGPYVHDCHPFLSEVKYRLKDSGFERAKLCTDRDATPPKRLQQDTLSPDEKQELREFWTKVSYSFLQDADVAIFFFLDPSIERSNLPQRAFRDKKDPKTNHTHGEEIYDIPQDSNGSVMEELNYWSREMNISSERTMTLFEKSNYEETGSLVSGSASLQGYHWDTFETNCIDAAVQKTRARCANWVMNECKSQLQDRYNKNSI